MTKEESEKKITHKHVHHIIKKHAPRSVVRIKKLFHFRHYKLFLLFVCLVIVYHIFSLSIIQDIVSNLEKLSYLGSFISGILIVFGFSAPLGIAYFLIAQPQNLFLAALIGGLGAAVGDALIFRTIKLSLKEEFGELKKIKIINTIESAIKNNKSILIKHYLIYVFAGILIALPIVPDEIGVSMLAGLTTVKGIKLTLLSFLLHSIAIFLLLYFGFRI